MNDINVGLILLALAAFIVILFVFMAIEMVNRGYTYVVECLGRHHKTLTPGLHFLLPFVGSIWEGIGIREQVVLLPPQPVITSDNVNVSIDTVICYQVTNPIATIYEIASPTAAIEQLAVTTLRNIIGAMDMEQTLTGRDQINGQLRGQFDGATGCWDIRVSCIELKAIDPPRPVQGAMKRQMKTECDHHAAILTAEGVRQPVILTAEDEKQSAILEAEGQAQPTILRAQGGARAILQVLDAIRRGNANPKLLSYEYIKTLPQIANSSSSKPWIVPAEMAAALSTVAKGFGGHGSNDESGVDFDGTGGTADALTATAPPDIDDVLADAKGVVGIVIDEAETLGCQSGRHFDPDAGIGQRPAVPTPLEFRSSDQESLDGNGTPPAGQ